MIYLELDLTRLLCTKLVVVRVPGLGVCSHDGVRRLESAVQRVTYAGRENTNPVPEVGGTVRLVKRYPMFHLDQNTIRN